MKRPLKMMMMVRQEAETDYKLFLYDEIKAKDWEGWELKDAETSAKRMQEALDGIPDGSDIELHVNSAGGDAYQGVAIYNALKQKDAHITAYVDGLACSAATLPLMAAEKVIMGVGTNLLVHNMWAFAMGNAEELRKVADDLDKMMESNRKIYLSKCNLTEDELIELMEKEEFLTPEEAVEMGFADEIAEDSEEDPDDNKDGAGEEDPEDGEEPEDPEDGKEPEAPDDEDDPEESVRISASQCAEFLGTFF
ncbi:head maturation protease, ClpP-related [Hornefia butyriciproducens]|uniref:head maturation protease, ClpP-related n=1 Tax=Hornefia butyriciproducens TaxID=2652293 RepID=UPI003F8AEA0A